MTVRVHDAKVLLADGRCAETKSRSATLPHRRQMSAIRSTAPSSGNSWTWRPDARSQATSPARSSTRQDALVAWSAVPVVPLVTTRRLSPPQRKVGNHSSASSTSRPRGSHKGVGHARVGGQRHHVDGWLPSVREPTPAQGPAGSSSPAVIQPSVQQPGHAWHDHPGHQRHGHQRGDRQPDNLRQAADQRCRGDHDQGDQGKIVTQVTRAIL
jgi:hypothetical protein